MHRDLTRSALGSISKTRDGSDGSQREIPRAEQAAWRRNVGQATLSARKGNAAGDDE